MEAQEFDLVAACNDGSLPEDGAIVQWHMNFVEGANLGGIDMRCNSRILEALFKEARVENVISIDLKNARRSLG